MFKVIFRRHNADTESQDSKANNSELGTESPQGAPMTKAGYSVFSKVVMVLSIVMVIGVLSGIVYKYYWAPSTQHVVSGVSTSSLSSADSKYIASVVLQARSSLSSVPANAQAVATGLETSSGVVTSKGMSVASSAVSESNQIAKRQSSSSKASSKPSSSKLSSSSAPLLGASITDYQHRSPAFYSTFPASASGAWCYKTIGTEYLQFNYIYSIVYITVDLRNYQQCPGDSVVANAYYNGSLTKAVKSFSLEAGSSSKVSFYPKCYQHGIYWYTQPGTYRFVLHDNTKNLDIMNISCNLYEKGFY